MAVFSIKALATVLSRVQPRILLYVGCGGRDMSTVFEHWFGFPQHLELFFGTANYYITG